MTARPLDPVWTYVANTIDSGELSLVATRAFAGMEVLGFDAPPVELVVGREVVLATAGAGTSTSPWTITRARRGTSPWRHLRRAMISMLPHTIVVTNRSGVVWDYTARWGYPRGLHISTSCPGGPERAEWTVEDYYPFTSVPSGRSTVVISDSVGPYWIGLIDENDPEFRVDGGSVHIVARGYSLRATDAVYTRRKVFDAFTPVYQIMNEVRQDLFPEIIAGDYQGGGRSIVAESGNFLGKNGQTCLNEAAAYGDLGNSGNTPVYWFIRGVGGSTTPQLDVLNRDQCTVLRYHVPIEWLKPTRLAWRTSQVTNQALVQFDRGTASSNNLAGQNSLAGQLALGGTVRSRFIDGGSKLTGIGAAQQIGKVIVDTYGIMQPNGSIAIEYPHFVYDQANNEVEIWRMEAGHPIDITGIDTGNDDVVLASLFITGTNWDADGRVQTLTTEQALKAVDDISAYIRSTASVSSSPGYAAQTSAKLYALSKGTYLANGTPPVPVANSESSGPGNTDPLANAVGVNGRIGYPGMPQGADAIVPTFQLGNGKDATSLDVGVHSDVQFHFPYRVLVPYLKLDDAADVTIRVSRLDFDGVSVNITPLFDIASSGGVVSTNFSMISPFTDLGVLMFEAETWLRAECTANDGVTAMALLTLFAQKLDGITDLGITSGPAVTMSGAAPAGDRVHISVDTEEPSTLVIEYGADENYGAVWPWELDYKTEHRITINGLLAGETYYWTARAFDTWGNESDAGSGSFVA